MKQTRMRMTKDAASLIHEYRDGHDHKTNTDAVYGLISDLDVANCNEVYMSKQIAELEAESERLDKRINAELSRGRHLCNELQSYVRRLKKENYSLAEEIYNKPPRVQHLFWRAAAVLGWGALLGCFVGDLWSNLS